jgi:tRNA A-37 threonylcarbamoyl transferase component Bud32/tetratricopeptide (TPR) repeat protein
MAAPLEKRTELLQEQCGDDATLRAIVESTLLDLEAQGVGPRNQDTVLTPTPQTIKQAHLPKSIGQFSVRRLIGTGGMGAVYEAMQDNPRRKVAVKVMKRGITSASALRRFHLEAQLLGRLHHIGIAQIYEAGTWDDGTGGVPFFAMEYIAGAKEINQYANDKGLDTEQKLELFAQICDAVHHGHQKGIIHRDLKPGNVLVDRNGKVKVIDFGVARSTDSDLAVTTQQTDVGALIGTLQYMSPEQCEADPDIIDTRSDVYSLGVMLYELLCGRTPYDLDSIPIYDAVKVVREQPPTKLSVVSPMLRGDLETIVSKALAKDPDYRYQSAVELKLDLERYGRGDPISARPLSLTYQVSLLMRRNKPAVVAIGVIAAVLVVATALSIVLAVRASSAETRALQAQAQTEAQLEKARVGQAFQRDILAMSSPRNAQGRTLSTQQILIEAAAGIDERFDGLPELAAETRLMVGELMFELQLFDEADRAIQGGMSAIEARHGEDDVRVIAALALQAQLRTEQGRPKEAEALSFEALERAERSLEGESPVLIDALAARVMALSFQTRFDEAQPIAQRWMDLAQQVHGAAHEQTLHAKYWLGTMLAQQSGLEADPDKREAMRAEARRLLEEAVQRASAQLGPMHPVSVRAAGMLALLDLVELMADGEMAVGIARLEQATADASMVLGPEHTFVLEVLHSHGRVMMFAGKTMDDQSVVELSWPLLERALAGYVKTLGADDPRAQAVQVDLGQSRSSGLGDLTIAQLQASYDRLLEVYGEEHFDVLRARALLAIALLRDGQVRAGEPLMRRSFEALVLLVGPAHGEMVGMKFILAEALIDDDQVDAGLDELSAIVAAVRTHTPDDIDTLSGVLTQAALLMGRAGRLEAADAAQLEAAQLVQTHLEPASDRRVNVLTAWALALAERGTSQQALEIIDDALAGLIAQDAPDQELMQLLQTMRWQALVAIGDVEQARTELRTGLEQYAGDPEATASLMRTLLKMDPEGVVQVAGPDLVAALAQAHDAMDDSGPRLEALQAKLHGALGNFTQAVHWQERRLAVVKPDGLEAARERLAGYRASLEEE